MKQLKIVQEEVDSDRPFFTANFTESITISPDSRIWFDKISFNILPTGIDGDIELGSQVIQVAPNVLQSSLSQGYRDCYLEGATYKTINDLYLAMNRVMNGSLTSNPVNPWGNKLPDTGLAYMVTPYADKRTEISFVQAPCVAQTDGVAVNTTFDGTWWTTSGTYPDVWSLIYPQPILAGALQCNTAVWDPLDNPNAECFVGLYTKDNTGTYVRAYGFNRHDGSLGTAWRFYNNGGWTFIPNQTPFQSSADPPTIHMSFFVDANDLDGHLRCGLFDYTDPVNPVELLISPLGTFQGYDVNTNYYFGADGFYTSTDANPLKVYLPTMTYQPVVSLNNNGWLLSTGADLNTNYKGLQQLPWGNYQPFPTLSAIGPRNVRINFTQSQPLMNGIGFNQLINYMSGLSGSIVGANIYGFINFYDLALDVFNFSLESYRSTSAKDNKGVKGRVATVGYFVPIPTTSSSGETMYYAENKQLTFIDINNKQDQVIESLNFRMYNPSNPNEAYRFANVSFTLFIEGGNTKADGLLIRS